MPRVKLTDLTIRSLQPPARGQVDYYDINHPGLCLRVSQGGSKVFTFLNRQNGTRRRITIGKYPNVSLSDARAACRGFATTNSATNRVTFGEAAASYLTLATGHMSRSHVYELTRILNKTFQPLHAVQMISITSKHISDIIDTLPANALYTHGRIKTFMRWCRMRSLITVNPVEFLPPPSKYIPRDRILTDLELAAIWSVCPQLGTFGLICKLLVCTGQRRGQIAALERDWIQNDCIIFPASIMKTRTEHVLPIGPLARSLLPDRDGLLFPSSDGTLYCAWSRPKRQLEKLSVRPRQPAYAPQRLLRTDSRVERAQSRGFPTRRRHSPQSRICTVRAGIRRPPRRSCVHRMTAEESLA